MSKSELKRMCVQNPLEMAERIVELERKLAEQQADNRRMVDRCCDVDRLIAQAKAEQREEDAKICEMFYRDDGTAQECAEAIRKGGVHEQTNT